MMKEACMSYSINIGDHIVNGDINFVMDRLDGIENVDMVIGGPPCQGFSVAGKMDVNDKRSQLYENCAPWIVTYSSLETCKL